MEVEIKKFGEKRVSPEKMHQWYETTDGVKHDCNEDVISFLHCKWAVSQDAERLDEDGYCIYGFTIPFKTKINNE